MHHKKGAIRILSVVPSARGIGFAVLETPKTPIDWGLRANRLPVADLLRTYRPDVLIVEDVRAPDCRKGPAARRLVRSLERVAERQEIAVRPVSRTLVAEHFEARNKVEVAVAVAKALPLLRHRVPPRRKIWMSEDHRMPFFDAFALILAAVKAD